MVRLSVSQDTVTITGRTINFDHGSLVDGALSGNLMRFGGGNTNSCIYSNYAAKGDGLFLSSNYFVWPENYTGIYNNSLASSEIAITPGLLSFSVGGVNTVPVEYLRIGTGGAITNRNNSTLTWSIPDRQGAINLLSGAAGNYVSYGLGRAAR